VQDVIQAVAEDRFVGGMTVSYGLTDGGLALPRFGPQVEKKLRDQLGDDGAFDEIIACVQETLEAVTDGTVDVKLEGLES
jgi:hypothetical protein